MPHQWTHAQLLELKRFNTPTVSNALEHCSARSPLEGFNREETRDFMPHLGPMVGHVITAEYRATRPTTPDEMAEPQLMATIDASPKPVIVVMKDLDAPDGIVGAPWGECLSNACHALGAVGTVTDGAIRDYHEMVNVGLHAIARRLCVSHAFGIVTAVGNPVEVFGTTVRTGDVLHADCHGFLILPDDVGPEVIKAAHQLDQAEMEHLIGPSRRPGYTIRDWEKGLSGFKAAMAKADFKNKHKGNAV